MKKSDIEALIGREPRKVDLKPAGRMLAGARVMITGAGGSIGLELARLVARLEPAALVLVNHSELALYEAGRALGGAPHALELVDVRDADDVCRAFERHNPEIVFHAAAMKHVPICEDNPCAAVLTNVQGTANVRRAAGECGTRRVVLVSTDKAVKPSSVMGATKRCAERIMNMVVPWAPGCSSVRFGNVLGSSGSVLPLFKKQLASGPLTVTHPLVSRYFMTIREAASLVLAASALVDGGPSLHVLDMGAPVSIARLARQYGRMVNGVEPMIVFTGLRPGEKFDEDLFYDDERPRPSGVPGVLACEARAENVFELAPQLAELTDRAKVGDVPGVSAWLHRLAV